MPLLLRRQTIHCILPHCLDVTNQTATASNSGGRRGTRRRRRNCYPLVRRFFRAVFLIPSSFFSLCCCLFHRTDPYATHTKDILFPPSWHVVDPPHIHSLPSPCRPLRAPLRAPLRSSSADSVLPTSERRQRISGAEDRESGADGVEDSGPSAVSVEWNAMCVHVLGRGGECRRRRL